MKIEAEITRQDFIESMTEIIAEVRNVRSDEPSGSIARDMARLFVSLGLEFKPEDGGGW